jgi:hypothetical protein
MAALVNSPVTAHSIIFFSHQPRTLTVSVFLAENPGIFLFIRNLPRHIL